MEKKTYIEELQGITDSHDHEVHTIVDDVAHAKLVKDIGTAVGTENKKRNWRTEATTKISEFHARGDSDKIQLDDLISGLTGNAQKAKHVKSKLHGAQGKTKLNVPLHKHKQQELDRAAVYEETQKDVSKWDSVIKSNQTAEQLQFPLEKDNLHLQTVEESAKHFKARTPLELEIAELLHGSGTVVEPGKVLSRAEERALKAMSLEEAKAKRAELMKFQSKACSYAKKNSWSKKIKSKKYRRHLRNDKKKQEKKLLEELKIKDPEAYAERMEKAETERVTERMSLKHRGGSKKMRRQMLYGKYNEETRHAVQDMIQKNKELTKKSRVDDSSDEEHDGDVSDLGEEGEEPTAALEGSTDNPWVMQAPNLTARVQYKRPQNIINIHKAQEEDEAGDGSEEDDANDDVITKIVKEVTSKKRAMKELESKLNIDSSDAEEQEDEDGASDDSNMEMSDEEQSVASEAVSGVGKEADSSKTAKENKSKRNQANAQKQTSKKLVKTMQKIQDVGDIDSVFDEADRKKQKTRAKLKELAEKRKATAKPKNKKKFKQRDDGKYELKVPHKTLRPISDSESDAEDNESGLIQSETRKSTLEEMDGDWSDHERDKVKDFDDEKKESSQEKTTAVTMTRRRKEKRKRAVRKDLDSLQDPTLVEVEDSDADSDEEWRRMTIREAFAGDDVVSEFTKDKQSIIDAEKVKDVDLSMPGWGSWAGAGIKPKRKRARNIIKAPKMPARQDSGQHHLIISSARDKAIQPYQVKKAPFPYNSSEAFEKSIRAPTGRTWNTEVSFQQLTKPKVITRKGQIITPFDKSMVLQPKKSVTFS